MTTVHKNLTGADLHEPKGAATALSGQVYVANGSGSGVWTDAASVVTNTAFTTGDLKPTHKTTADTSWILWSDGTIGDGSSSATIRANADTSALFTLYWNSYSNTLCPVSTGRGASAAADFAAHKTIALPVGAGRAFGLAGTGSGLTARTVGVSTGAETAVLVTSNLPPYTPSGSVLVSGGTASLARSGVSYTPGGSALFVAQAPIDPNNLGAYGAALSGMSGSFTGSAQGGTSTAFSLMQPTAFVNVMIKL